MEPAALERESKKHSAMVVESLQALTRWAFPGSKVESAVGLWRLVHRDGAGLRRVDFEVRLEDDGQRAVGFTCTRSSQGRGKSFAAVGLTREALDDTLRRSMF